MKKQILLTTIYCLFLAACQGQQADLVGSAPNLIISTPAVGQILTVPAQMPPTPTSNPNAAPSASIPQTGGKIPNFDHIILTVLENEDYSAVIGNTQMPQLNALAKKYVTLSNYFAVAHPSLPNYIALMSGDTQNITSDCTKCFISSAPNLADLIEASGRTWKTYEEDMPSACFVGDKKLYAQKHDPLIYFDSVRLNPARCSQNIVPLPQLDSDLAANKLPNFSFVMANLCNSGHDCTPAVADAWIGSLVSKLTASPAVGKNSLIIVVYDEGAEGSKTSCCGLLGKGGGQVAALFISPLAKPGFSDNTAYDHYSVTKTILSAWNLPALGNTRNAAVLPVAAPFLP